jgi:hypothetical protein
MRLYKKKNSFFILLIILILILITFPLDKKYYKFFLNLTSENFSTYDLGYSRIEKAAGGSLKNFENIKILFGKIPTLFNNVINGVENRPDIKTLEIRVKFKEYQKILEDRKKALKIKNYDENFQFVNAKILFDQKKMSAKVRLKGHLSDHWKYPIRMSLKIAIKDNNSILGYKEFFIHKPESRQHPHNQVFLDLQKAIKNISINQNYMRVIVNNDDWGIMNVEEAVNKEFLEKSHLKESLIVEFRDLDLDITKAKKYLSKSKYRKFYSYISSEHLSNQTNLYHFDSFSKALLLNMIWGDNHALQSENSKYYFNPYSLKVHPIARDQGFPRSINEIGTLRYEMPFVYKKIYENEKFKKNIKKNIDFVRKKVFEHQKYYKKWNNYFPLDEEEKSQVLKINDNKIAENLDKYLNIYFQEPSKKRILVEKINKSSNFIFAKHFDNGEIHIYNKTPFDIELIDISLKNKKNLKFNNQKIRSSIIGNNFIPTIIKTNFTGIQDNNINIKTKLKENIKDFKLKYTYLTNGFSNPLLDQTNLEEFNFLKKIGIDTWQFNRGTWEINKPLIVDGNLKIKSNTKLNFSKKSFLIVKGNLFIEGELDDKVILQAQLKEKSWKGIYVFKSTKKSLIKNAIIKDINFLEEGILNLSGGINFYKSDVEIINTEIENSFAEDALNIVKSNFFIENLNINKTKSDGIDSDFSTGIIKNSLFSNIGGDAIDFSGSKSKVQNVKFLNIKDKSISSGEESTIILENLKINNTGVGVASKDGSTTKLNGAIISDYKLSALMTYNKKSFYDYPKLISSKVQFDDSPNALMSQTNSYLSVNGNQILEQNFDVKKLYKTDIMKK